MVHVLKCLEGQDFWQHSCLLIPFCHVKLWYVHINCPLHLQTFATYIVFLF